MRQSAGLLEGLGAALSVQYEHEWSITSGLREWRRSVGAVGTERTRQVRTSAQSEGKWRVWRMRAERPTRRTRRESSVTASGAQRSRRAISEQPLSGIRKSQDTLLDGVD